MKKQGKILVVDDNRNILSSLRLLLDDVFEDVMTLPSPKTMLNVLAQGVDAVLLDMNFVAGINNGNEGLYWLHKINDKFPDVPVVLFTAYADVELAVQAMKDGAFDFVEKPWDNTRLIDTLMRAVKSRLGSAPANPAPTEMVWGTIGSNAATEDFGGEGGTHRRQCADYWRKRYGEGCARP